jgi:hypothetical protein
MAKSNLRPSLSLSWRGFSFSFTSFIPKVLSSRIHSFFQCISHEKSWRTKGGCIWLTVGYFHSCVRASNERQTSSTSNEEDVQNILDEFVLSFVSFSLISLSLSLIQTREVINTSWHCFSALFWSWFVWRRDV